MRIVPQKIEMASKYCTHVKSQYGYRLSPQQIFKQITVIERLVKVIGKRIDH